MAYTLGPLQGGAETTGPLCYKAMIVYPDFIWSRNDSFLMQAWVLVLAKAAQNGCQINSQVQP